MARYAVSPAHLEKDKQVVIDLWRRNLTDLDLLEEKYDWHFLNNPSGPGQIWILEANGQPVGTTALGVRPLKLRNKFTAAGVACDLAVDKGHRFLQPAVMLERAVMSSADAQLQILYGIPNMVSASIMKYVGYREYCPVHRYARVLRVSHYLRRFAKFSEKLPAMEKMADRAFSALQSIRRSRDKAVVQVLPTFDERFDELWSRLSSEHSTLTIRDRHFLKWRYLDCPLHQYKTLGLLTEDGSNLLGYLIYYVEDSSAHCADLCAAGGAEDLQCLLFSWAALAYNDGLASLSISCSDAALATNLLRQGFSRRSVQFMGQFTGQFAGKPGRKPPREQCKALLTHERFSGMNSPPTDNWYYTDGDFPY